jgi:DNA replication protein DnaC
MARTSTGKTKQANGYEFYKPTYAPPIVIERQKDLSRYGIKGRYKDVTFETLKAQGAPADDREMYNNALKYGMHLPQHIREGKGLIMTGPVGTGKTSLAVCILRWAINQGYRGYMISMTSLFDTLMMLSKGPSEHYLKFESRIQNCPLLVLDDFGAEYDSEWVKNKVNSMLSERVERKRSTILTTNMSIKQIQSGYNERVYDRMKQTLFVLTFKGESQRRALDIKDI